MRRRTTLALSAMTVLWIAPPRTAVSQTAKDLVGAWMLISSDTVRPDGIKIPTFGDDPKGIIIFTSDGRFIYLLSRGDLPKFASNNRNAGSPEENKAVVQGSIATFGTYSVAGTDLMIKVENSTFPNWIGADQKRTIAVTGDQLKWTNATGSGGGVVELVLKRAAVRTAD